jgi:hypothetical protein
MTVDTLKGLLVFFENYYGEKYTGVFLQTVTDYLGGHTPDFYKAAAEVLVKRFSRIYNKVPGLAEFETHMDEIKAAKPTQYYLSEPKPEVSDGERAEVGKMADEFIRRAKAKQRECLYTKDGKCQNEKTGMTACLDPENCRYRKSKAGKFGETLSKAIGALGEAV